MITGPDQLRFQVSETSYTQDLKAACLDQGTRSARTQGFPTKRNDAMVPLTDITAFWDADSDG